MYVAKVAVYLAPIPLQSSCQFLRLCDGMPGLGPSLNEEKIILGGAGSLSPMGRLADGHHTTEGGNVSQAPVAYIKIALSRYVRSWIN